MVKKRIPWWLIATLLVITLLLLVGSLLLYFWPGIHVTVQNAGTTPMRSVVLHVTGNSYRLGDIPPGASATARVHPKGESGLQIEFTGPDGKTQPLDAGGYFESGYRGTIRVLIRDGTIVANEQRIKLW